MTHLKKSLAMLLALIMMFSSMSVAANAWNPEDDPSDITFTVKFFRFDADEVDETAGKDGWIETTNAAPGEKVVARVYVKTGFYTYGGDSCFLFDKTYLSIDGYSNNKRKDITVNEKYAGPADDAYGAGEYNLQGKGVWKDAEHFEDWNNKGDNLLCGPLDYIRNEIEKDQDFFDTYDLISNNIEYGSGVNNSKMVDDDWMYQFEFVVNDNPKTNTIDSEGSAEVPPYYYSLDRTAIDQDDVEVQVDLFINFLKGEAGEYREDATKNQGMWLWVPQFATNPGTITTTSEVVFDMGLVDKEGNWAEETYTTEKGIISKDVDLSKITDPTHPEGNEFLYWSTQKPGENQTEATAVKYDYDVQTLYAVWGEAPQPADAEYTLNEYFMNADGTYPTEAKTTTKYIAPDSKVSAEEPSDERYSLDETKSSKDVVINADGSSVVNAYYERNTYKLVYHYDGMNGEQTDSYDVRFGDKLPGFSASPTGEPQKTGYTFKGWTSVKGGTIPETLPTEMPTEEIHFYPIYEENDTYVYEYIFNAGEGKFADGESIKRYFYQYLEETIAPEEPTVPGKKFVSWDDDIPAKADGDREFNAIYEDELYTVTFKADTDKDGVYETTVPTSDKKYVYGEKLYLEDAPENYPLDKWKLSDGTSVVFGNDEETAYTVTGDVTFYTVGSDEYPADFYWSQEDYENGAEPFKTVYVKYDELIPDPGKPEKDGYNFLHWDLDLDGQIMDTTEGKYFIAVFEAKDITVTYDPNEGECDVTSETVKYDENASIKLPEASRDGYEFKGWVTPDGTNVGVAGDSYKLPTDNITLTADWDAEEHTITFVDTDGKELGKITADTDEEISTPANLNPPVKEGHEFAGWTAEGVTGTVTVPATMPADDMTLTATWNKLSYALNADANGGKFDDGTDKISESILYGDPLNVEQPDRDGHKFLGWANADDESNTIITLPKEMPAKDLNLTAEWEKIIVNKTITLDADGGKFDNGESTYTINGEVDSAVTAPANPTKEGYAFDGWVDASGKETTVPSKIPAEDVTITAKWAELYDVTYYSEDGTTVIKAFVDAGKEGAALPAIDDPVKDGWHFTGWVDKDGNKVTEIPAGNIDLFATFEENAPTEYTITYKDTDGSVLKTVTYAVDAPIAEYAPDAVVGKTFKGWIPALPETMPAENLTVEAVWETNKHAFTLDANGGTFEGDEPVFTDIFEYNTDLSDKLPANPTRDGYEFAGWDGELPSTMPDYEVSLKATWTPVGPATHKVEYFYAVDGDVYETLTVEEGKPIVHPADPTVEGLTFVEWVDKDGNAIPDDLVMGTEDLKIYAKFDVNTYNVTYIVDGEVYKEYDVLYQEEVPVPDDPADSPERVFAGWDPNPEAVMPAHDLTYTAKWADPEPDKYTATFLRADGKTHSKQLLAEGDAIEIPEAPKKFGYVFVGWEPEVPDVMPAQDMVFEPQYEVDKTFVTIVVGGTVIAGGAIAASIANAAIITGASIIGGILVIVGVSELVKHTHTVTYIVDGEEYKTYKVVEGTKIPVPADPVKDGYTFEGWNPEVPEKMGDSDLVFEAVWGAKAADDSADVDVEIPETGSVAGGLTAFAVISGAAAAAYVITRRKKED